MCLAATLSGPASAETASSVEVRCSELDAEAAAAVEARQLGELKTRGGAPGQLLLECREQSVFGVWSVGGRLIAERTLSRHKDEVPTELLHWLAAILLETREERASAGIDDLKQEEPAVRSENPVGLDETEPHETEPDENLSGDPTKDLAHPALGPPPAPQEPSLPPRTIPNQDEEARSPEPVRYQPVWEGALGARGQLWDSRLLGSIGPLLVGGVRLHPQATIDLELSPQFSIRRSSDFGVTDWTGALVFCAEPFGFAGACLSGVVSLLYATSPSSVVTEVNRSFTAGGEASVRFLTSRSRPRYFLSLGGRAMASRREVLLNDDEIATIPHVQGTIAFGIRGEPFASAQ